MADTDGITPQEMREMFGTTMPMEAVNLIFNAESDEMTLGELRARLRAMGREHQLFEKTAEQAIVDSGIRRSTEAIRHAAQQQWSGVADALDALKEQIPDLVRRARDPFVAHAKQQAVAEVHQLAGLYSPAETQSIVHDVADRLEQQLFPERSDTDAPRSTTD